MAVAKSTVMAWSEAADRLTVKTASVVPASPSVTVTSLITSVGKPSSSMIVPVPWLSVSAALTGLVRVTTNVSFASCTASPRTGTVMCCVVVPGLKVNVPLAAV